MTIVEAIDEVIKRHLGRSDFGLQKEEHYWARLILNSDLNDTLTFGISKDSIAVEELRRTVRSASRQISALSYSTRNFKPRAHAVWILREMIDGRKRDFFDEATVALSNLENWLDGLLEHSTFRNQATNKRNWRAASVVQACRITWAAAKWESSGRALPKVVNALAAWHIARAEADRDTDLQAEYSEYLISGAPLSDKPDKPGPFGRFAEDVFETLGIFGKGGERFSAASALRSLSEARKQEKAK